MFSRTRSAVCKFHYIFLLTILAYGGCSAPTAETQPPHTEQAAETNTGESSTAVPSNVIDAELAREIDHLIDDGEPPRRVGA